MTTPPDAPAHKPSYGDSRFTPDGTGVKWYDGTAWTPAEPLCEHATLLHRAATRLRTLAGKATHRPGRWTVDVSVLADGATHLGPLCDALTATLPQAAHVKALHPPLGVLLADWLDSAALDTYDIGADGRALAVAREILRHEHAHPTTPR